VRHAAATLNILLGRSP